MFKQIMFPTELLPMKLDPLVAIMSMLLLSIGHNLNKPIGVRQTEQTTKSVVRMPSHDAKAAKTLFKRNCAKCHGVDGRGNTAAGEIAGATDLTNPEWQEGVDGQRIVNSITHGRGQMPSFQKKLSKDQIETLAVYVRTLRR